MIAALPVFGQGREDGAKFGGAGCIVREGKGFTAGELQEFAVTDGIGNVEAHVAGLASAKKFARAPEQQIGFGDFKSIGGAHHGVEARTRFFFHVGRSDENAVGLGGAAADATAQLVKLRQAKAFGVFDNHDGGIGHVHTDFDDGGGDEDVNFIFAETLHDRFFVVTGKAAVENAEFQFRKNFAREAVEFFDRGFQFEFRFFDNGIDDIGLMAGGDFATHRFPDAGKVRLGGHARDDGSAARRQLVDDGDIEVAVET